MSRQIENRREYFAVDNYEQVYADVRETWQDPEKALQYHEFFGKILHPIVHFAPKLEDRIGQETKDGALLAIAFTHGSALDPVQIAAMAYQQRVFHSLMGNAMIGAKVSLFTIPFIGERIPDLAAVPVWVKKDVLNKKQSPDEQERLLEFQKLAGVAFIETEIVGMNEGRHLAKHVYGTRNKKDPTQILQVRDGFGKVVSGVDPNINILMLTGAFYYGRRMSKTLRKPTIYLDILEDQSRTDPDQITANLSPALQATLNQAVLLHKK